MATDDLHRKMPTCELPSIQDDHVGIVPPLALRPNEAAKALGIGVRKLWEITADQTSGIPHARLGKCVVYPVRELQDWLAQKATEGRLK